MHQAAQQKGFLQALKNTIPASPLDTLFLTHKEILDYIQVIIVGCMCLEQN